MHELSIRYTHRVCVWVCLQYSLLIWISIIASPDYVIQRAGARARTHTHTQFKWRQGYRHFQFFSPCSQKLIIIIVAYKMNSNRFYDLCVLFYCFCRARLLPVQNAKLIPIHKTNTENVWILIPIQMRISQWDWFIVDVKCIFDCVSVCVCLFKLKAKIMMKNYTAWLLLRNGRRKRESSETAKRYLVFGLGCAIPIELSQLLRFEWKWKTSETY